MKRAAAIVFGWVGYVYLRFCFWTSRYVVTDAAEATLRRTWDLGVPTVYACWHDEFLISLLNLQCRRFPRPLFITNDSFGGTFLETFCRCVGNPVLVLQRGSSREAQLEQLAAGLAAHRRITIAADYGRPWYKARATAHQLAERPNGYVVAVRLEPRRKWMIPLGGAGGRAYMPVPFSSYAFWLGEPHRAGETNLSDELAALSKRGWFAPGKDATGVPAHTRIETPSTVSTNASTE